MEFLNVFGILDKGRAMNRSSMEDKTVGADVDFKIAGQEINFRNIKSINTIATVCTLIAVTAIGVYLHFHEATAQNDKTHIAATLLKSNADVAAALKESNKAIVEALKESNVNTLGAIRDLHLEQRKATQAIKEGNCLQDPVMKNRPDARDACKRLTGRDP